MRIRVFTLILAFCMIVLVGSLCRTQLFMYERFRTMSEGNRLKVVPLMAPRGTIFDSSGRALVKDVLSFNVSVIYSRIKDVESLAEDVSRLLDTPREELLEKIKKGRGQAYRPVTIASDVGVENAIHVEEASMDHPGLLLEVSAKREYIYGTTAANMLGYLGLLNRSEFNRLKHYGYRINDLVGRSGIEKQYDDYLRGSHGGKQVEVDYRGQEATILGLKEPVPGKDVQLTIDIDLQKFCDGLLTDKRGAIVVMDPYTGAILAMASSPTYDPAIFIDSRRNEEVKQILYDNEYPLLNRAISGAYPPGSVFKVVVASAALEEGVVTPETVFSCSGSLKLGRRTFHCWKKDGHGEQSLKEAIKNSCNVFFWRLGMLLGVDNIAKYAEKFGIGSRTGIDVPGEVSGNLPSSEWKKKRFKEKWYKGETLNYAVGQGYLITSPLQVARMMSVFANGGALVTPYLVSEVGGVPVADEERVGLDISPETIEIVREGLKKVVNDRRGTGMKAKLKDVVVAGKTGTAQTSKSKNHGWFAGFAPFEDTRITVVIFDEYGGKGGYYAAGTGGKVIQKAYDLGLLGERE
ncbi:MAG: penicillin-binding protein 2 [Candidatus Tantalella remota]|nr:penicillin-binding protein 2 [Candidatus Tantalella remota]